MDTNGNGKIDTIEVTFVRDVHGSTVNHTGTDFTVDGYDIKKAKETNPGIVQITLDEKTTNDSGTIPIVTLKNDNIKDITSDTYNHQQTATPIDGIPPTKPTVDIPEDKYLKPQTVEITSLDVPNNPTIFYTLDGSDPATSSAKLTYSTPIKIDGSSVTLKAIAQDPTGNKSEVMTETYEIAPKIEDASIAVATSSSTGFTITWTTDRPSYSRLVFGTKSKKTKGTDTKYGYDKTTNEASIKQTTHTVTLAGLIPGTTYYYRLISRGSPEQVTDERSITLASDPTPTPTQTPTPTPTSTPTPSPTTTPASSSLSSGSNNTVIGDGKSDGLGCSVRDCSDEKITTQNQVLTFLKQTVAATGLTENVLGTKTEPARNASASVAGGKVKYAVISPTPPINSQSKPLFIALTIFLFIFAAATGVFFKIRPKF